MMNGHGWVERTGLLFLSRRWWRVVERGKRWTWGWEERCTDPLVQLPSLSAAEELGFGALHLLQVSLGFQISRGSENFENVKIHQDFSFQLRWNWNARWPFNVFVWYGWFSPFVFGRNQFEFWTNPWNFKKIVKYRFLYGA